ncbi:MAG: hypothetical protein ACYCSO_08845, partial [Cuniculiplasma sp.]
KAQEKQFHKGYTKGHSEKERESKTWMISVMHSRLIGYGKVYIIYKYLFYHEELKKKYGLLQQWWFYF